MKPSAGIRQRKRGSRPAAAAAATSGGGADQVLKNVESDNGVGTTANNSATSEHGDNRNNASSQIDLASSLATKLALDDGDHRAGPAASRSSSSSSSCQTWLTTGLQNLTLQPGQLRHRQPERWQRLRQTEPNGLEDVAKLNNGNDNNNNNSNNDISKHVSGTHGGAAEKGGRQGLLGQWRQANGAKSGDKSADHGNERSDNDAGDQDEDDDTDSESDCDRLSDGGLQADTSSCCSSSGASDGSGGGGGGGGGSSTIQSDNYPNSTGYNADESLSPHCVDSDDKSSSSATAPTSSSSSARGRPAILRHPRRMPRAATTTTSGGGNKLARGDRLGDKLGGETGSERESSSCSCRGVQDHHRHHHQRRHQELASNGDGGAIDLLPQLGGKSERFADNTHGNCFDCKACRCGASKRKNHHLGERPNCAFGLSSQHKSPTQASAKCSEESGGWFSSLFRWIPAPLQPLFSSAAGQRQRLAASGGHTRRRRRSRRLSAVELEKYPKQLPLAAAESSGERASSESLKYAEWQQQRSPFTIGGDQEHRSGNIMPNSNANYGSGARYQPLLAGASGAAAGSSRRASSGSTSRNRPRSSASRVRESNGYLRLGNSYYQKTAPERSLLQELKRILLLLIIVAICGLVLWQIYLILIEESNYLGTVKFSPSKLGHFQHYAVSTDAEPCAKIGRSLLAKGGHAVDAALGTLICMGIALPNSLGLGGGCLMTIYDNTTKKATVIDGREIAPDYATETMFAQRPLSASRGPLSIGVPGELAAYAEAHRLFGRLPWAMLFEESIQMAEQGFPTVEHLSSALRDMTHAKYIQPQLRAILTNNATGDYYSEGEIMRLPQLAQTLRRIRDNGAREFYDGQTGQLFIEDLQRQGGKMTMENLRRYKALVKPATVIKLDDDLTVYTQPIPGSGLVLSIILRILKELGYYKNLRPRYSFEPSALYYHHLAEALKFAYAQRAGLEDQPDDPGRMERLVANITSAGFIKSAVRKINNSKTQASEVYGGLEYFQADHGTAHTSVIDHEGNAVAITTSVNLYFGSGLVSPRTGIIYNDVMDDFTSPNLTNKFSLPPSKYNRIRPGKRPLSSMAPSVFVDSRGNPKLIVGASGGSKITSAIATVALRNLFFDEDLKTAIDGPRIHHQFLPDQVWYEANFAPELLASLKARGHSLQLITGRSSVVMGIACNYTSAGLKHITANSDYRKGGSVDGL